MNWNRTRILVTGAGGFIGSHLLEALVQKGARVTGLLRYNSRNDRGHLRWADPRLIKQAELIFGDLADSNSVAKAMKGSDVVFHLGAVISIPYSYRDPAVVIQTNVMGTTNILQEALRQEVNLVVHTSTSEVYGTARTASIREDHPMQAQSPYSASKIAADKIAESFHKSFGLPVVILRPFNTYGPRQSTRAVIPTVISQALANSNVRLGSLSPRRDFTYVSDTVGGFLSSAECPQAVGRSIHLGTGTAIPMKTLASKILSIMGKRATLQFDRKRTRPPQSEVEILKSDPRLANRLMGWKPTVSLDEGLRKTVQWFEEHRLEYSDTGYAV